MSASAMQGGRKKWI